MGLTKTLALFFVGLNKILMCVKERHWKTSFEIL